MIIKVLDLWTCYEHRRGLKTYRVKEARDIGKIRHDPLAMFFWWDNETHGLIQLDYKQTVWQNKLIYGG